MPGRRRDPYEVLGVPATASAQEIARAYRGLARRLHPDAAGHLADAGRFDELARAYAAVGDPVRRAEHDRGPAPDAVPAGAPRRGPVRVPVRQVARPRRGADLRVAVPVPLRDALLGGPVDVELPGRGRVPLRIPAGVDDGQLVRFPGLGADGRAGGAPGDLLVEVRVVPDRRFTRRGADVATTLHVRWSDAVLGAELPVETPAGRAVLALPPGTASGSVLEVPGGGVPGRGDLLVTVVVDVPPVLDDAERDAVVRLAQVLRRPGG